MKNAKAYEKKIRTLLRGVIKIAPEQTASDGDPVTLVVLSVLQEDATLEQAGKAMAALQREYVDFNELRVSPVAESAEQMGKDYPAALEKANAISEALNAFYKKTCRIDLDYMHKMTKRDLRRHLLEVGLSPYAASCLVLLGFDGHAIPVDQTLVECLQMQGYADPGSDLKDVQGFLERIISHESAPATHAFFRIYIKKCAKALSVKRAADAKARAKAERKKAIAEAAAEAKRKAAEAKKRKKKRKIARAKTLKLEAKTKSAKKTKAKESTKKAKAKSRKKAVKKKAK